TVEAPSAALRTARRDARGRAAGPAAESRTFEQREAGLAPVAPRVPAAVATAHAEREPASGDVDERVGSPRGGPADRVEQSRRERPAGRARDLGPDAPAGRRLRPCV